MQTSSSISERTDLRKLSLEELKALVASRGLPEYRYRQIARWLYDKSIESIDQMTDLSRELREELAREWTVGRLEISAVRRSQVDGTEKLLLRLKDGSAVESVWMPTEKRITFCVSTQVGCTLDCIFCQTGKMGFFRNLAAHEILEQVILLRSRIPDRRIRTNVVFMGMGEPLHNVEQLIRAIGVMMDPLGLNMGSRRITVSTSGVVPGIRKLAASGLAPGLAISLNATTDELRHTLMPRAAKTPIAELMKAARDYAAKTARRVTIEYVLIRGVNDAPADADRLAGLVGGGPFKVNVIPYNPGASPDLERPHRESVDRFATLLHPKAPVVTVRWSMGPDISAACGQLKVELEKSREEARREERNEAHRQTPGPGLVPETSRAREAT
jgi:23S rRNA (adenine2503-C2)-methyltransferase